jgi:quercetin dioxygenase-like cupin family protein
MPATLSRRLHNPVTGDRIEILSSPLMDGADTLLFRCTLLPGAAGAPLHSHAEMHESFIVVSGVLTVDLGQGQLRHLSAGERIDLQPGTDHGFRNSGDTEVRFLTIATPGLELEKFFRAVYGLAADGQAGRDGTPKDPRALATAMADLDMVMGGLPTRLQRPIVRCLAALARRGGVAGRVARHWGMDQ